MGGGEVAGGISAKAETHLPFHAARQLTRKHKQIGRDDEGLGLPCPDRDHLHVEGIVNTVEFATEAVTGQTPGCIGHDVPAGPSGLDPAGDHLMSVRQG